MKCKISVKWYHDINFNNLLERFVDFFNVKQNNEELKNMIENKVKDIISKNTNPTTLSIPQYAQDFWGEKLGFYDDWEPGDPFCVDFECGKLTEWKQENEFITCEYKDTRSDKALIKRRNKIIEEVSGVDPYKNYEGCPDDKFEVFLDWDYAQDEEKERVIKAINEAFNNDKELSKFKNLSENDNDNFEGCIDKFNLYNNFSIYVKLEFFDLPESVKNSCVSVEDWQFKEEKGKCIIEKYIGSDEVVTIPKSINDLPISKINPQAFENNITKELIVLPYSKTIKLSQLLGTNSQIEIVRFEEGIEKVAKETDCGIDEIYNPHFVWTPSSPIGKFYKSLSNLKKLYLPSTFKADDNFVFLLKNMFLDKIIVNEKHKNLQSISDNNGLAFNDILLYGNENIVIPECIKRIGDFAFNNCNKFENLIIPAWITHIGKNSFAHCHGLKNVIISDGVTSIGEKAFYKCENIVNVKLPNSIKSIGQRAFLGNDSLEYSIYENGKYLGNDANPYLALIKVIDKNTSSFKINDNCRIIYDSAFEYFHSLEDVTLPNCLVEIGSKAFNGCGALKTIQIPECVTRIGERAFYECESITSITIPDSVTSIGEWTFYGCSSLTSITIPKSITSIGEFAFDECVNLQNVEFNEGLINIDTGAFSKCNSLKEIVLPDNLISLGQGAFSECENLEKIVFNDNIKSIGYRTFYCCKKLNNIILPNSIELIDEGAFTKCSSLTSITIPNQIKIVSHATFNWCSNLLNVSLPSGIKAIEEYAFWGCNSNLEISFDGTINQWNSISIKNNNSIDRYTIKCIDGIIKK